MFSKKGKKNWGKKLTRQFPGLNLVHINLTDGYGGEASVDGLSAEIMSDQLFIGGVESKSGREVYQFITFNDSKTVFHQKQRNRGFSASVTIWMSLIKILRSKENS